LAIPTEGTNLPVNLAPLDIHGLLNRYGIRPNKHLGQNFLTDTQALVCIVKTADIHANDTALEIGPGLGSLTRILAQYAACVLAIEIDPRLIAPLQDQFAQDSKVHIIQGDILTVDIIELIKEYSPGDSSNYVVVANIPYYITSALIRYLLELRQPPKRLVLTIQFEVAERICAQPGKMSLLALSVQVYGKPQLITRIPADAFYPIPKVDSAVVRLDSYPFPLIPRQNIKTFFRLAKAGFSQKRKTLRNALSAGMHWDPGQTEEILRKVNIDPMRRAETLGLEEWRALTLTVDRLYDD
jgi:16S rRNA (adenine1518-N6/adenine1519-N6)-dimethyltransferase